MNKSLSHRQRLGTSEEVAIRKVPTDNLCGSNRKITIHKSEENEPSKQESIQFGTDSFLFFAITVFLTNIIQSGIKALKPTLFCSFLHFDHVEAALYIHLIDSLQFVGFVFGMMTTDNILCRYKGLVVFSLLSVVSIVGMIFGATWDISSLSISSFCLISFSNGPMNICFIYIICEYLFKARGISVNWRHYFIIFSTLFAQLLGFLVFPIFHSILDIRLKKYTPHLTGFIGLAGLELILHIMLQVGVTYVTYKRTIHRSAASVSVYLIVYSISRWFKLRKIQPQFHFLHYGKQAFKKTIIRSTKKLMVIFPLILPFPIFQAALCQRYVTWTLIAEQMNTTLSGKINIHPAQIQVLSPLIKLLLLPIYFLTKRFQKTDHHYYSLPGKLVTSYFLGGAAFYLLATNERYILNRVQVKLNTGDTLVHFVNAAPCPIILRLRNFDKELSIPSLKVSDRIALKNVKQKVEIDVAGECGNSRSRTLSLKPEGIYSIIISENVQIVALQSHKIKSHLDGWVRFVALASVIRYGAIKVYGIDTLEFHNDTINPKLFWESEYKKLTNGRYSVYYRLDKSKKQKFINDFQVDTGVTTTIVFIKDEGNGTDYFLPIEDWKPRSPTVFYLIPIFVLLTVGELFFFVAILEITLREPYNLISFKIALIFSALSFGDIIISLFKVGTLCVNIHAWDSIIFGSILIVTGMLSGQGAYYLSSQLN